MKLLVTGGTGMLARAVISRAKAAGHEWIALSRAELDVTRPGDVAAQMERIRPDAVVQCAAFTRVDDAELEADSAFAVNAEGAANVARACARVGATFVYPSTDYVFDGAGTEPYRPDHPTAPINTYGQTKLAGEEAARTAEKHLVVRTSWLYGAGGRNFVGTMLRRARAGDPLRVVNDQRGGPTWTCDLAHALLTLIGRAPSGTYHFSNAGETTWFEFARATLDGAGIRADLQPTTSDRFTTRAIRPSYSVLDCSATVPFTGPIRDWRAALADALQAGV